MKRGFASAEETTRPQRLDKSRRDCLAAHWLASAPVGSPNDRRRSRLMSCVEQPVKGALCEVSGPDLRPNCLQSGHGWRNIPYVLRRAVRATPQRKDGLERENRFC